MEKEELPLKEIIAFNMIQVMLILAVRHIRKYRLSLLIMSMLFIYLFILFYFFVKNTIGMHSVQQLNY